MSEEILKALMQLFAIIAKQDEGAEVSEIEYVHTFLKQQLSAEAVGEYMELFKAKLRGKDKEEEEEPSATTADGEKKKKVRLTSVKDSVKTLGISKKINKTLNQKQKAVVLVRLFELVNTDRRFTEQRMQIINTVADVFKITKDEFKSIETFVIQNDFSELDLPSILIATDQEISQNVCKHIETESIGGNLLILQIKSVDLYFLRYTGFQEVFLNGLALNNRRIYLFASGSTIKLPKGKPIYYSDVVANFLEGNNSAKLTYNVKNLEFRFPNNEIGLHNICFSETQGKLIGIMGASGAGKTTLLNVLSGITSPSAGEILINGINMHTERDKIEGVIGYIPQDDLLIEELTVFENLYYNAKLCFRDKNEQEIIEVVHKTLINLGLFERKDLKVGTPLNKMISGGQRKRLNIALELIREPSILFVDEPTSGLSSRDSENVMDLLSELTLKGKLIFVVIHQPSSDIYKMFDKMVILDTGGYLIYYGNPVEALMYFKRIDAQINSEVGECPTCGNVTPELIFNIIESRVVDEFGRYTGNRKIQPTEWESHFKNNIKTEISEDNKEDPPRSLNIPSKFTQFKIYTLRDFFSKVSNTQYVSLNLIESPLLGFILAYIIRYIADPDSSVYIFRENENIPPYIFMSIIVALFLGLTVSAEEIFRDRKILKREKFLNLSRLSYITSKILILTTISAIQAIQFVLVGNLILDVQGMFFVYWFALFTAFVFANLLGLNISATFNSAVTIYILIPLLIIPQMALGGAMFSFDKLNRTIGTVGKVPVIAEFMTSRWIYEALMVHQFKYNKFENYFYDVEQRNSVANFKQVYYLPKLSEKVDSCMNYYEEPQPASHQNYLDDLKLLTSEINRERLRLKSIRRALKIQYKESVYKQDKDVFLQEIKVLNAVLADKEVKFLKELNEKSFTSDVGEDIKTYLAKIEDYYGLLFKKTDALREKKIALMEQAKVGSFGKEQKAYHNEALSDYVKKVLEKNKILEYKDQLEQNIDPIFLYPEDNYYFGFRSHFYAPKKFFLGRYWETYWFNMCVVWFLSLVFCVTLYFEHLKKLLDLFEKIKLPKIFKRIKIPKVEIAKHKTKEKVVEDTKIKKEKEPDGE